MFIISVYTYIILFHVRIKFQIEIKFITYLVIYIVLVGNVNIIEIFE